VSSLQRLIVGAMSLVLALMGTTLAVRNYGAAQYRAGQVAAISVAVAASVAEIKRQTAAARKTESDLRAQLRAKDADAFKKEQEHAESLAAAQRRMLTRADSLRCPAGPVPDPATPSDRPATPGPGPDTEGPALVPEVAADLLGIAADFAGLVRRYDRVVERFDACRAVNEK
jgi:hypothetical protein